MAKLQAITDLLIVRQVTLAKCHAFHNFTTPCPHAKQREGKSCKNSSRKSHLAPIIKKNKGLSLLFLIKKIIINVYFDCQSTKSLSAMKGHGLFFLVCPKEVVVIGSRISAQISVGRWAPSSVVPLEYIGSVSSRI